MSRWHPIDVDPYVDLRDRAAQDAAVGSRRATWLRRNHDLATATWAGMLRDLAERGHVALVRTGSGRAHHGTVEEIGNDYVVLMAGRDLVFLRGRTVRTVRTADPRAGGASSADRGPSVDRNFDELLERLVEEGRTLSLVVDGVVEPIVGQSVVLGEDIASVDVGGAIGTVHVPLDAVVEVIATA